MALRITRYDAAATPPDLSACAPFEHRVNTRCTPAAVSPGDVQAVVDAAVVADAKRALRGLGRAAQILVGLFLLLLFASLLMPGFVRFPCRSMQSEAKGNLKALYVAQESHRAEHNTYGDVDAVGFAPKGATLRYRYVLTSVGPSAFEAFAYRIDGKADDVWHIDERNALNNVLNGCAK